MCVLFFVSQFSFYLADFAIESELLIGIAIATSSITSGIASFFFKYIKKAIDTQVIFIITMTLVGSGFFILSFAPKFWLIFLGSGIAGFGWGIFMPNINSWLLLHTPERLRGRVVGIFITMLYLGQFVSPLIAEAIILNVNLFGQQSIPGLFLIGGIAVVVLILLPITLLAINIIGKYKARKSIESVTVLEK